MRHLDPVDADGYVGIATGYLNEGRPEAEAIAILQAIILDGKRNELWQGLGNALAQFNHSGVPALTFAGGKYQLHTEIPEVRSVVCSAYQGMVRECLLSSAKPSPINSALQQSAIGNFPVHSSMIWLPTPIPSLPCRHNRTKPHRLAVGALARLAVRNSAPNNFSNA